VEFPESKAHAKVLLHTLISSYTTAVSFCWSKSNREPTSKTGTSSRWRSATVSGLSEQRRISRTLTSRKTSYDGNVDQIETCIVYEGIDEEYLEKCRNEWDNCREKLEKLEEQTAILTQGRGESLRLLTGEFDSTRLQSRFESGIDLPTNPKTEFIVTESWEKECLAVAISPLGDIKLLPVQFKSPRPTSDHTSHPGMLSQSQWDASSACSTS